jgi:hypothetical protein
MVIWNRVHCQVLGCLNSGEISVFFSAGHGTVVIQRIPFDWIPLDLRMPNSEFDLLVKYPPIEWIRVLRKEENCPEIQYPD